MFSSSAMTRVAPEQRGGSQDWQSEAERHHESKLCSQKNKPLSKFDDLYMGQ